MRGVEQIADVADPKRFAEGVLAAFGHEMDLVAEIDKRGVDGRRGEHQYFGVDAGRDHFIYEFLVTLAFMIAEVVGLVDDQQVEVLPVEIVALGVQRQIRVRPYVVRKWVPAERV